MTTNQTFRGRLRPAANQAPIPIQAEIADDYEEVVAEPVALGAAAAEQLTAEPIAIAPVAAEQVAAEPVDVKAVAVSIAATLGSLPSPTSPEANKSDAEFDLSAWPLNMLDLFSANAAAVLDFATALGQAKSLTDAIELQSRFASERYSTLLRQTNEIAELMRRSTFAANAPFHLSVRAFIA
jgi:cell division septation protein DedD